MKHVVLAFPLLLLCGLTAAGCDRDASAAVPELTVDEVARRVDTDDCIPVDANSPETRAEYGTLPNARLLSSSSRYDVAHELPADKASNLVFYCGGTRCTASDAAAARARQAGYENVSIMRAGIRGWVDA